ncbi:cell filamentation protein Fic [Gordonibacter sp. 28C]|uniref:Fic/DOC family protein n=1 Tax=Gordonibacter sp. 28C TaxID=2078569 RepID=UPI000DF83F9F|nr:Fic family protein [Gordonibacter sp. 28C]RDB63327.1 cell filamentation protein Fic [Gordonibacter sp. 28C]
MPDREYGYAYDAEDAYLYAGTDVLANRFGIRSREELWEIERALSGARIAEIDISPVPGSFDLDHLCAIHRAIFGDLYPWAGVIRTKSFIAKGASLFCSPEFIVPYSNELFGKLKSERYLQNLDRDSFIVRLAYFIAEINALHPFREGNGRAQRAFANQLARNAGWELNFRNVEAAELCEAYIESMHVSTDRLERLLREHVTPAG